MKPPKQGSAPSTPGAGGVGHGREGGALYSTTPGGVGGVGCGSVHQGEGSQEAEGHHELGRAKPGSIRIRVRVSGGALHVLEEEVDRERARERGVGGGEIATRTKRTAKRWYGFPLL